MLQPLWTYWSTEIWITFPAGGLPRQAVFKVPARSIQSRLRITSAAARSSAASEPRGVQRVVGRKDGAGLAVGHDPGADRLGERDPPRPSFGDRARPGPS